MNGFPPISHTEAEVFILESLSLEDEENERFEGRILRDILKLSGKKPKYYYFRTEKELVELAKLFRKSGYRFLHISSHGSHDSLGTTLEAISYNRFGEIFDGLLRNRRLFLSACEMGNELFSTIVAGRNRGMYSIIAPTQRIRFDRAAAIWAAFYVLMFDWDDKKMKAEQITNYLQYLGGLFSESFHFSQYHAYNDSWSHNVIQALVTANGPNKAILSASPSFGRLTAELKS